MNKGVVLGLIGFAAYSVMDLNHKYSMSVLKIDFFTYIFYMILIASISLTVMGLTQGGFKVFFQLPKGVGRYIVLRGLISVISIPSSVMALSLIPMHVYYPIILLAPMLATVFSCIFLGEKFSKEQFLIIMGAFIGVLLITRPWQIADFTEGYAWGLLLSIYLALAVAIITIISRVKLSKANAVVVTWYGAWFLFLIALAFYLLGFVSLEPVPLPHIPYLISGGVFYSLGLVLFTKSYGIGPIKKVAPTSYTQLMWGVLFDIMFFHSYTTLVEIVGICIIAGVNFINLYRK